MTRTMVTDVNEFLAKFDIMRNELGNYYLPSDVRLNRLKHIMEELAELVESMSEQRIAGQVDALVDITYLCLGTLVMMGAPVEQLWDEVHRANMSKVKEEGIGHKLGVTKPLNWQGPKISEILDRYASNPPRGS